MVMNCSHTHTHTHTLSLRVVVDGGGAKVHSPPKFENPDTAFDNPDQMNEQEELEKEQDVRTRLLHGAHHPAIVNVLIMVNWHVFTSMFLLKCTRTTLFHNAPSLLNI